jgi:two-component system chemotaxis response regulator CheB
MFWRTVELSTQLEIFCVLFVIGETAEATIGCRAGEAGTKALRWRSESSRDPAAVGKAMNRDLIAIGGSAGSLDTVLSVAAALPDDFTGTVFVVIHVGQSASRLPELLARVGDLPATHPNDREPIRPRRIYVAPPDWHLTVERGQLRLWRGPREHFTRPAIDPLFRSLATVYGRRVVGVVLSGGGSDGAAGLDAIKRAGGLAVVLDPNDAVAPEMPRAATEIVSADYIAPAGAIPGLLVCLSREKVEGAGAQPQPTPQPEPIAMPERPLALTCPECGGALRKVESASTTQYRCHIGHVFGGSELLPAQAEMVEKALRTAERVLNERAELLRRMVEDARISGRQHAVSYWEKKQAETERQVDAIRQLLLLPGGRNSEDRASAEPLY